METVIRTCPNCGKEYEVDRGEFMGMTVESDPSHPFDDPLMIPADCEYEKFCSLECRYGLKAEVITGRTWNCVKLSSESKTKGENQ